jgi:succinate-acetate transporter protein
MAEEVRPAAPAINPIADPAPLGLGAFALTTFILSLHNSGFQIAGKATPLLAVFGFAIFYGGLGQFLAGMMEFRNRNTFGATAFSTYGAFWMGLAAFITLILLGKVPAAEVPPSLGVILLAFAIFNTYMLIWASRINMAVFLVFATLELTEILLFLGNFNGDAAGKGLVSLGGYMGIITALVAWYASAAGVVNSMSAPRAVLPVGKPMWGALPASAASERPLPRREVSGG